MRIGTRTGMLLGLAVAELAVCGGVWAATGAPGGMAIIVRKSPGGQNMACMDNGKPCSPAQVRQVAAELHGRGINVSLAGTDGGLQCTTKAGPCTDEHVVQVQAAGRAVAQKGASGNKS